MENFICIEIVTMYQDLIETNSGGNAFYTYR